MEYDIIPAGERHFVSSKMKVGIGEHLSHLGKELSQKLPRCVHHWIDGSIGSVRPGGGGGRGREKGEKRGEVEGERERESTHTHTTIIRESENIFIWKKTEWPQADPSGFPPL